MATLPRPLKPGHWLAALTPLLILASGCVTTGLTLWKGESPPPTGLPCQIVANWKSEVMFTPNAAPGGNGALLPGIAGRLYLFGPKIDFPFACEGAVTVELIDEAAGPNGQPAVIEVWHFDSIPLKRLLVKDFVGWGYTLFLPLEHYRPEGLQGHLKVTFEPAHGTPFFTQSAPTLFHPPTDDGPVITTKTRQVAPPTAAVQAPQTGVAPAGMPGTTAIPAGPQTVQVPQSKAAPMNLR